MSDDYKFLVLIFALVIFGAVASEWLDRAYPKQQTIQEHEK